MNNSVLFHEQQRFKQWWLWLLILGLDAWFAYACVQQLIFGNPVGSKPMPDVGMIVAVVLISCLTLLFFSIKLETQVTAEGISVRFFPIHRSFRKFTWEQLDEVYVREYAPLREFGGWGLRYGRGGKAYNVSGKTGLQLEFKNGDKLLIGTQQGDKLTQILQNRML